MVDLDGSRYFNGVINFQHDRVRTLHFKGEAASISR